MILKIALLNYTLKIKIFNNNNEKSEIKFPGINN